VAIAVIVAHLLFFVVGGAVAWAAPPKRIILDGLQKLGFE